jgi:hypothetical protein
MTKTTWVGAGALVFGLTLAGCAPKAITQPPAPVIETTTAEIERGIEETTTVTITATVKALDQKTRMATLLGPDGDEVTFRVDDRVTNLPQVKVGDEVVVVAFESIAVQLRKRGAELGPGATVESALARAEPGQRPAIAGAREMTVTAKIVALDRTKQVVTLEGPEGNQMKVKVRHPERLSEVAVGDLVDITYMEALAIAVEKPPKQ